MRTPEPDWLSVADAARLLNLSPRAVQHRIKAGKIKAEKFGDGGTAPYMIRRSEVENAKASAA